MFSSCRRRHAGNDTDGKHKRDRRQADHQTGRADLLMDALPEIEIDMTQN
jgi:hypothetical protein